MKKLTIAAALAAATMLATPAHAADPEGKFQVKVLATGVLPDGHPQNMHVGGSKGSVSGNFAMSEATLLVAIGTRAVCQSDCSGSGFR